MSKPMTPLAEILCRGCNLVRTVKEFEYSKEKRYEFCLVCRNRGETRKVVKL